MEDVNLLRFRKMLAISAAIIVTVHVLVILYLTVIPKASLGKSKPGKFYEYAIHLGPFFREESISAEPRFYLSTLDSGTWTSREVIRGSAHTSLIWRLDELLLRNYIRFQGTNLSSRSDKLHSKSLRKIHAFLLTQDRLYPGADSARITWMIRRFGATPKDAKEDTVFSFSYNPTILK